MVWVGRGPGRSSSSNMPMELPLAKVSHTFVGNYRYFSLILFIMATSTNNAKKEIF